MSIFYALISKNFNIVLSEYTDHTGNFQQITRIILYKLKDNYTKLGIIRYNKYIYSYITEENLIYLCISDNKDEDININDNIYLQIRQKEINIILSFLVDIKKNFLSKYSKARIEQMKSYEIKEFNQTICSLMNYYNNKTLSFISMLKYSGVTDFLSFSFKFGNKNSHGNLYIEDMKISQVVIQQIVL